MSETNKNAALPQRANYPFNENPKWNEIPLGLALSDDGLIEETCIDLVQAPNTLIVGGIGTEKTAVQRSIVNHCIQYPDHWRFYGIDLKGVELTPYRKYLPVVDSVVDGFTDAVLLLASVRREMRSRYARMDELNVFHFTELPDFPHAMLVMFDEVNDALAPLEGNSAAENEENRTRATLRATVRDIARLGRAAGIHLILASSNSEFLDSEHFQSENFANRLVLGKVDADVSNFAFQNNEGENTESIQGRGYFSTFSIGQEVQTYYAPPKWADKFIQNDMRWIGHWEEFGEDLDTLRSDDQVLTAYETPKKEGTPAWSQISIRTKDDSSVKLNLEKNLNVWITEDAIDTVTRTKIISHCTHYGKYWQVKYINLKDEANFHEIAKSVEVAGTLSGAINILRETLDEGQKRVEKHEAVSGTVQLQKKDSDSCILLFIDEASLLFNDDIEGEEVPDNTGRDFVDATMRQGYMAQARMFIEEIVLQGRSANIRVIMSNNGKDYIQLPHSALGRFGVRVEVYNSHEHELLDLEGA